MIRKIHPIAGVIGFFTIVTFWTSTVYSEVFGTYETIYAVKNMILEGMFILIPAMAIVGASGMSMGHKRKDAPARAKIKRMPVIAANGLLILLPAAFFLQSKAGNGEFDTVFYAVQALELIAGAINIIMMGLSLRDGIKMGNRRREMAKNV